MHGEKGNDADILPSGHRQLDTQASKPPPLPSDMQSDVQISPKLKKLASSSFKNDPRREDREVVEDGSSLSLLA